MSRPTAQAAALLGRTAREGQGGLRPTGERPTGARRRRSALMIRQLADHLADYKSLVRKAFPLTRQAARPDPVCAPAAPAGATGFGPTFAGAQWFCLLVHWSTLDRHGPRKLGAARRACPTWIALERPRITPTE